MDEGFAGSAIRLGGRAVRRYPRCGMGAQFSTRYYRTITSGLIAMLEVVRW